MSNKHVNLTAYEGVEKMERFSDASFQQYCADKLSSCSKHVAFVKKIFPDKHSLDVLEVGSGSGKLLFRLEKEGMLSSGTGFEPSGSRVAFAARFGAYVNSSRVQFRQEDVMTADLAGKQFDLIIGIDVVINLIGALSSAHLDAFFSMAIPRLKSGGCIILESITLEREIAAIRQSENGVFNTWKRFADSDPFKYGLDQMSLDAEGNLVWEKFFIERNSGREETFTNVLQPLGTSALQEAAQRHGLQVAFYNQWDTADDTSDEEFIAVFTK
jgi:SAM-dependent methyltransferase